MTLTQEQIAQIRQAAGREGTMTPKDKNTISLTEKLGLTAPVETSPTSALKSMWDSQKSSFDTSQQSIQPELATAMGADTGAGFVKGAADTALNVGTGLQNIVQAKTGENIGFKALDTGTPENIAFRQKLQPTPEQELGKTIEKGAEFLIPGSVGFKAPAAANFLTKALVEGIGSAAVGTAQTGSLEEGLKTGALAGGISAALGAPAALARNFGVPEKLYKMIFKDTFNSSINELKSGGIEALQKNNPELFKTLSESGIIKSADEGIKVNESLAKQALDKGIKGSIDNMANMVVTGLLKSEHAAQTIAKNAKTLIKVPEEQFANVFKEIADDYKNVGFGEMATKASELESLFKSGSISTEKALEARRLLDGLRVKSSYNPNPKLSLAQDNLKFLSDKLRSRLSKVEGFGDVMKQYSFNIQALEALAKEAVKRDNANVIGLIDSTLIGAGGPVGMGIAAGRKFLNTPTAVTNIASSINKASQNSAAGQAVRGAAASLIQSSGTGQ